LVGFSGTLSFVDSMTGGVDDGLVCKTSFFNIDWGDGVRNILDLSPRFLMKHTCLLYNAILNSFNSERHIFNQNSEILMDVESIFFQI